MGNYLEKFIGYGIEVKVEGHLPADSRVNVDVFRFGYPEWVHKKPMQSYREFLANSGVTDTPEAKALALLSAEEANVITAETCIHFLHGFNEYGDNGIGYVLLQPYHLAPKMSTDGTSFDYAETPRGNEPTSVFLDVPNLRPHAKKALEENVETIHQLANWANIFTKPEYAQDLKPMLVRSWS